MSVDFDFDASPGFVLSRAHSSMRAGFNRAIYDHGIDATAEQWGVLNIIQASPGIIQSEIAGRSMKDRTNVTRMLDVLEKNGLIERKSDAADRRLFRIFITPAGTRLLKRIVPLASKVNERAMRGLSAKEVKSLLAMLNRIYDNMRE